MKPMPFLITALLAAALAMSTHAQEKKTIVIKLDGKDVSSPEAAQMGVDKALEALHGALATKDFANINVDEIRATIRKSIDDAGLHGTLIHRHFSRDAVEKNNPYSAREVREFKQILGDGTVISRQSTRLLARDQAGRTRQELQQPDGSSRVFINDPVAKEAFILDPQKRTGCRANFDARAINHCYSQIKGDWKPLGFALHSSDSGGLGMLKPQDDLTVEISPRAEIIDLSKKYAFKHEFFDHAAPTPGAASLLTPPAPPVPAVPPPVARDGRATGSVNTQVTREKKSGHPYQGLNVDTDRTVETIAVGSIGNNKAIVTEHERYYSPELKTNVYVRRSDPRNGESVYRMVDVKRHEPDAQLFRAPAGYTMSEGKR